MRISDLSSDVCSSDLFRPTRFLLSLHQTWIFLTAAGPIAGDGLCARFPARGGFGVSLHPMAIPSNYGPAILIPAEAGIQSFAHRSEEHTSELQSLMRLSYACFCLKQNNTI